MDNINGAWLYPIILIAGALQAWGPPMHGALRNALTNPWLASIVSFIPVIALLAVLWLCQPRPMPTIEGISNMPWWAPLGGVVGAFAVIAGLLFVDKVGPARSRVSRSPPISSCRSSLIISGSLACTSTRSAPAAPSALR